MLPESIPVTLYIPSPQGWSITSGLQPWSWVFDLVGSQLQQTTPPEWAGNRAFLAPYSLVPDGTSVLSAGGVVLSCPATLSGGQIQQLCGSVAHIAYLVSGSAGPSHWILLLPTSRLISGQEYAVIVEHLSKATGFPQPEGRPLALPLPLHGEDERCIVYREGFPLDVDPLLGAAVQQEPIGSQVSAVVAPGERPILPTVEAPRKCELQFPESARIGLFADYMSLVEDSTESPACFAWGSFAACFAVLLGRTLTLPSGASSVPPTIHVGLVGATSLARKSSAIGDALAIVLQPYVEQQSSQPHAQLSIQRGSGSGEGFAEAIADCEEATDKHAPKGPKRVITGRRAIFVVEELGSLLGKVNRDQAGNMTEFMITTYDSPPKWTHLTRGKGSSRALQMTNATGVFLCASTYEWLTESMTATQVMAGLTNRFLWLTGTSSRLIHRRPEIPADRIRAFQTKLYDTLARLLPGSFTLTTEADALHEQEYMVYRQHPALDTLTGAATGRSDALVLRVAMLLAASETTRVIGDKHIRAAWDVIMFSNQVAGGIVEKLEMRNLRESQARIEKAIQALVRTGKAQFTRRDVYQRVKGATGMDAETFNRVFRGLIEAGMLVRVGQEEQFTWRGDG